MGERPQACPPAWSGARRKRTAPGRCRQCGRPLRDGLDAQLLRIAVSLGVAVLVMRVIALDVAELIHFLAGLR